MNLETIGRFQTPTEMFEEYKRKNMQREREETHEKDLYEFLNKYQDMSLITFFNELAESEDRKNEF